jgi:hypothetical protein
MMIEALLTIECNEFERKSLFFSVDSSRQDRIRCKKCVCGRFVQRIRALNRQQSLGQVQDFTFAGSLIVP